MKENFPFSRSCTTITWFSSYIVVPFFCNLNDISAESSKQLFCIDKGYAVELLRQFNIFAHAVMQDSIHTYAIYIARVVVSFSKRLRLFKVFVPTHSFTRRSRRDKREIISYEYF